MLRKVDQVEAFYLTNGGALAAPATTAAYAAFCASPQPSQTRFSPPT